MEEILKWKYDQSLKTHYHLSCPHLGLDIFQSRFDLPILFYAAYHDQIDYWFWIGIGLIGLKCLVPVLPNWVARHNKTIYSIIFIILLIVYFIQVGE
jgi:hypothetical protein